MANISIEGLSKGKVFAALYNAAKTTGLGVIEYDPDHIMTEEEAEKILESTTTFKWYKGRMLKIDLSTDQVDPWKYDRDNGGEGNAERIIDQLR